MQHHQQAGLSMEASTKYADNNSQTFHSTQGNLTTMTEQNFVFEGFVIFVGVIGTIMNSLVLSILQSEKLRKQSFTILLTNQVTLDLICCLFMVISYSIKVRYTHYDDGDRWGFFVCTYFTSDMIIYFAQSASTANLSLIAIERYFKVVHAIQYRKYFRTWMNLAGASTCWLYGVVLNVRGVWTCGVSDGECRILFFWSYDKEALVFGTVLLILSYLAPMVIFICCYGAILFAIRKQNRILHQSNHDNESSSSTDRIQVNVIATMAVVSASFVLLLLPEKTWFLLTLVQYRMDNSGDIYLSTIYMIFLNLALNPFIYAVRHETVRRSLAGWFNKALNFNQ